ncbi:Phage holin family protein, partial [Dysosmobacter welbionis]
MPGDLLHSLADGVLRHGPRRRAPGLLQGLDAVQCAPDLVRPGKAGLHGGVSRQPCLLLFVFLHVIPIADVVVQGLEVLIRFPRFLHGPVSLPLVAAVGNGDAVGDAGGVCPEPLQVFFRFIHQGAQARLRLLQRVFLNFPLDVQFCLPAGFPQGAGGGWQGGGGHLAAPCDL